MTTDSRWSCEYGNFLIYIDDSRFEKIERYKNAVFMFAGNGQKVQAWKTWIRSSPVDASGQPDCDLMCVCIADATTNQVLFSERQDIIRDGGYFAGSGSWHAYSCWSEHKDPCKAVETAKSKDVSSGGDVKFVDFLNGTHNLFSPTKDVHIDDVSRAMAARGNVMNIAVNTQVTTPPFKLAEAAANDPALRDIQGKIANGEISPTAPCDGMFSEWNADQKSKLNTVLSGIFGWKL